MPRKDRRFTGEDVKRFYCKNLTPEQRQIFEAIDCDWSDLDLREKVLRLVETLNAPPLSYIWDMLPGGGVATILLDMIALILEFRPEDAIPLLPAPDDFFVEPGP